MVLFQKLKTFSKSVAIKLKKKKGNANKVKNNILQLKYLNIEIRINKMLTLKPCLALWLLSVHLCLDAEADGNLANVRKTFFFAK